VIDELITKRIHALVDSGDTIIPPEAAIDLASALRAEYPAEVQEWLNHRLEEILHLLIRQAMKNGRSRMGRAIARAEGGDTGPLKGLLQSYYRVNEALEQKPLRKLTRDDLQFVAEGYEDLSRANANRAAFFRALQKQVPKGKTVGDVFDEDRLQTIYQQFID
jgi:hypothetical protein